MNGETNESRCPLWERLGCAKGVCARLCRRRRRRIAPELTNANGKNSGGNRESKRRINQPPSALYSALGERFRTSTPVALQCALFCGGSRCQYEQPQQRIAAIQGLYSDWVTEDILAMARPSTAAIASRNIIQQFHSWGIRTVINLQTSGEHASCGPPLTKSGFTYDPTVFMANEIFYYNFAWPDYSEASLSALLDMAKVLSFALQEGKVAIHCHAEPKEGICRCKTELNGKVALVTGGNTGIGLETARNLAKRGARVIIACRDAERSRKAIADIIHTTGNNKVEFRFLDLSNFRSVRKFSADFNKDYDRLDILVNNAGCAGLKHRVTEDGLEIVMQINYFGPFLLTNLLLETVIKSKPSRIVILTSYLHTYSKMTLDDLDGRKVNHYITKYSNSKLCGVLWAKALAKRLPEGVSVNSVHPGAVATDIFKRAPPFQMNLIKFAQAFCFKTPEEGAQTSIHVCVAKDLENVSGLYFKNCKSTDYSDLAKNNEFIEEVWRKSVALTMTEDIVQNIFGH